MAAPDRYLYRCTTDKLLMHIARVEDEGDIVEWPVFIGGRDWVLVCRKSARPAVPRLCDTRVGA